MNFTSTTDIEYKLRERLKELKCMYRLSDLVEQYGYDLDSILQGTADIIPLSWQYPEITCALITYKENRYVSPNFHPSPWKQAASIMINNHALGTVEVYYRKKMKPIDEGPFLREERLLIDALAERLGKIIERVHIKRQLEADKEKLNSKNIALREILEQVQYEKRKVIEQVRENINNLILPHILSIETKLKDSEMTHKLELLKQNLKSITGPSEVSLAGPEVKLSPTEVQICNMIRNGFSTKEIAQIRNLSPATIHRHRENIRKKLQLTNKKINLTSYLQNLFNRKAVPQKM